jgi:hypothetical protein
MLTHCGKPVLLMQLHGHKKKDRRHLKSVQWEERVHSGIGRLESCCKTLCEYVHIFCVLFNLVYIQNLKLRRTASPSKSFIPIERVSIECCTADVGNFNLPFLKATKNFYLKVSSYENMVCDMKYLGYRMFAYKV